MIKEKNSSRLLYEANCNRKRTRLATGLALTSGVACTKSMGEGDLKKMQIFLGVTGIALGAALITGEIAHRKTRRALESSLAPTLDQPIKERHVFTRRSLYRRTV